jgi:hypothetical protein
MPISHINQMLDIWYLISYPAGFRPQCTIAFRRDAMLERRESPTERSISPLGKYSPCAKWPWRKWTSYQVAWNMLQLNPSEFTLCAWHSTALRVSIYVIHIYIYWYTHFSTPVYSMQYKWLKCIYVMYPNTLWYFIYTSVWLSVKHYPLLQDFHVFPSGHTWVDRRSCSICAGSWKARANAMPANEATRMLSLDILQHASNNLNKFHIWIVFS